MVVLDRKSRRADYTSVDCKAQVAFVLKYKMGDEDGFGRLIA
jgi:hypothetical protein